MHLVHTTEAAERDLMNIWSYTYKNWGDDQADQYLDGLDSAIRLLADNPLLCRLRVELIPPVRIHGHAHHLIIYALSPDKITVVRVLHESMDIETQLKEEGD
jgi:toxin ParE1/3/4